MKQLIMINGTMGAGKSTVCKALNQRLTHSVWLDGDWCWMADPFVVNDETKNMVLDNITHMLRNFFKQKEYEHVIFCWVMDEDDIINSILER
ncbi:AAA family ATPase [[Eubacterium] hominis]|uniref:AAA family ATPase n=1 Tax=[Eubacterium] hominis TaxID=2764325 RepID=UPI003A4E4208